MTDDDARRRLFVEWDAAVAAGELVFWPSRLRKVVTLVVGVLLTSSAASAAAQGKVLGGVLAVVFGLVTVSIAADLVRRRPRLVVTAAEVRLHVGRNATVRIPWPMLEGAALRQIALRRVVELRATPEWSPEQFLTVPGWAAWLAAGRRQPNRAFLVPFDTRVDKQALAEWLALRAAGPGGPDGSAQAGG